MGKLCLVFTLAVTSLTVAAQNVGIGTATPAGRLHVTGSADVPQLVIDANTTQGNANPLLKLRNSGGSDLLWIHSDNPFNTFIGLNAGRVNTGINNTFIGSSAGYSNTAGRFNTAIGRAALYTNAVQDYNTAIGYQ